MKKAFLLIWFVLIMTSSVYGRPVLVLNTSNAAPNATKDHTGLGDRVIMEACKRIGVGVKIIVLPSERALINANEGIDDGNFARISGITSLYPNLVRVPEEVTEFEFTAFTKNLTIQTTNWASLKPYNVGIITGWKILETSIVGAKSLIRVKDERVLFNLLAQDKADVVVYDKRQGLVLLDDMKLVRIKTLSPALAKRSMYIYLHKKHQALAPELAAAIKTMKEDGTYKKIIDETVPLQMQ
ncbi:MAG: transporter substrate-binding domain-containing protein [Deltaproteobacteria bacterium]|nr:transporter substrate-binding domain-containing protein [Deltaproteobacteria bacterium]